MELPGEVLVKACLNGPRTKSEHKAIPVLAAEIATDVREVVQVGAGAVHFHPRGADGRETLDPESCGEVISEARELTPGVPIGISTAEWIERNVERKLELIRGWQVLPDFASVNFNEHGFDEVCGLLLRRGVDVEAGIWSLEDARRLAESTYREQFVRVLVEITEKDPSQAVVFVREIETYLDRSGIKIRRLHHGYGIATWTVLANALSIGRDIRAGMEDTLVLPDGKRAADNRQFVETAVNLARRFGREPSRPNKDLERKSR